MGKKNISHRPQRLGEKKKYSIAIDIHISSYCLVKKPKKEEEILFRSPVLRDMFSCVLSNLISQFPLPPSSVFFPRTGYKHPPPCPPQGQKRDVIDKYFLLCRQTYCVAHKELHIC